MDHSKLRRELITALRGKRTQGQLNQRLGFTFNKVYRWESGRAQINWSEFLDLCAACKAPLQKSLKDCFSYYLKPDSAADLIQHLIGKQRKVEVCAAMGLSRHTLARLLNSGQIPTLDQMLAFMEFGSIDFLRFLEQLTGGATLPIVQSELEQDRTQLEMFYTYPWLSALLSAIDLKEYRQTPTLQFIAKKSKLPLPLVKETIEALEKAGLIRKVGRHWEAQLKRTALRGSVEGRKNVARYVYSRTLDGVEAAFGHPELRFSWKLFSLNQKSYEKILQKYTEFFNELGSIIDEGQEDADKIYLFSVGVVDYDHLPLFDPKVKGPHPAK